MNDVPRPGADGTVTLRLKAPEAEAVFLAGDFNGWRQDALPMTRDAEGVWSARTPPLEAAEHTPVRVCYKLIVDGAWIVDPENPLRVKGDSAIWVPARHPWTPSDPGRVWTGAVYFSRHLGRPCRYLVYLPADYTRNHGRRFPVLYLLHGYRDGGASDWLLKGNLPEILDILIERGLIPPMIVVLPEAGDGLYADRFDGSWPLETALVQDLVPHVDSAFRTRSNRRGRAIGGVSAGGFGALKLALQYPHLFCSAHSHSGFFDVSDLDTFPEVFGEGPGSALHRRWNSPLALVQEVQRTEDLRLSFDCGEMDPLLEESQRLQAALAERGIPHGFITTPGYHNWDVWQRLIPVALMSHGAAFQGHLPLKGVPEAVR